MSVTRINGGSPSGKVDTVCDRATWQPSRKVPIDGIGLSKVVNDMAGVRELTVRLRADFVAWLEDEAARRNRDMEIEGKEFRLTAGDIAGPILEEAIQRLRAGDEAGGNG